MYFYIAKFLFTKLGLRRHPPLKDIVALCASPDPKVRQLALRYFLDNHSVRYIDFDPAQFSDVAFIPALNKTTPLMAMHNQVKHTNCAIRLY